MHVICIELRCLRLCPRRQLRGPGRGRAARRYSHSTVSQLLKVISNQSARCQAWRSHSLHSCRARPKPGHTSTLKLQMRTTSCSLRTPTHISASVRHGYARACSGCAPLGSFTKSQTRTHPAAERSPTCDVLIRERRLQTASSASRRSCSVRPPTPLPHSVCRVPAHLADLRSPANQIPALC